MKLEFLKEKVRGKPAVEASVGFGFGLVSWGLGLAELFTPHALLGWLGVDKRMAPLIRAAGLREIGTGVAILQNPVGPQFMGARVVGDALDLLVLGAVLRSRSKQPDRVNLAIGIIGAITLADIFMSARLTQLSASKTIGSGRR